MKAMAHKQYLRKCSVMHCPNSATYHVAKPNLYFCDECYLEQENDPEPDPRVPEKKHILEKLEPKSFSIRLILTTECSETVDTQYVRNWVKSHFDGCDVGRVIVTSVKDIS